MTPISHFSPDLLACIAIAAMAVGFLFFILTFVFLGRSHAAQHEASMQASYAEHYRSLYECQRVIAAGKESSLASLAADLTAMHQQFNRLLAMRRAVGSSPLNQPNQKEMS